MRSPALGSPRDEVGWGDAKTPAARGCCRVGSGRRRPRFGRFGRGADALLAGQRLLRAPGPVRAGHRGRGSRADAGDDARAATCSTAPTGPSSPPRATAAWRRRRSRARRPTGASGEAGDGTFTPGAGSRAEGPTLHGVASPRRPAAPTTPRPSWTRPARRPGRDLPFGTVGGLRRGPHALDDLRVPRRQLPLRQARGTRTASRTRCRTARRSRGRRAPRRRSRTSSTTATPRQPHDTRGYPKLTAWAPNNLTYEGTYWRWIQRAWLGGLRLMVMSVNENRVLCELQANRKTNCDEMDTVRRGLRGHPRAAATTSTRRRAARARASSRSSPTRYEARRVINAGQDGGRARDRGLRAVRLPRAGSSRRATRRRSTASSTRCTRVGVRSSLLLNKFDNPLTGVRFDSGPIGVLINGGNKLSAGSLLERARPAPGRCTTTRSTRPTPQGSAACRRAARRGRRCPSGTAPAYPPAPHCNTRGLTDARRATSSSG